MPNWTPAYLPAAIKADGVWIAPESRRWSDTARATLQTTNNGGVGEIENLFANSITAIQATGTLQPRHRTAILNGYSSVESGFDGNLRRFVTPAVSWPGRGVFFAVVQLTGIGAGNSPFFVIDDGVFAATHMLGLASGADFPAMYAGSAVALAQQAVGTVNIGVTTSPHILAGMVDFIANNRVIRTNGGNEQVKVSASPIINFGAARTMSICGYQFTQMRGHLVEMVYANRADHATMALLEGYAAHKYALTANLPAGHPYKTTAPQVQDFGTNMHPMVSMNPQVTASLTEVAVGSFSVISDAACGISFAPVWNQATANQRPSRKTGPNGKQIICFERTNKDIGLGSGQPENLSSIPLDRMLRANNAFTAFAVVNTNTSTIDDGTLPPPNSQFLPGEFYMHRLLQLRGGELAAVYTPSIQSVGAGNMTSASTTVTVNLVGHGFSTGHSVGVTGAAETAYNGLFTITVITANQFTYTALAVPSATPATGTINVCRVLRSGLFAPTNRAVIGFRVNTTITTFMVNGRTSTVSHTPSGATTQGLKGMGSTNGGAQKASIDLYEWVIEDRVLSDAEFAATGAAFQAKYLVAGGDVLVQFEGDSNMADSVPFDLKNMPYQAQFPANNNRVGSRAEFHNTAVFNSQTADVVLRAGLSDALLSSRFGRKIFVLWIGVNDLAAGKTAAQLIIDVQAIIVARRAAGYNRFIIAEVPPRDSTAGFATNRTAYNLALRTAFSAFSDVRIWKITDMDNYAGTTQDTHRDRISRSNYATNVTTNGVWRGNWSAASVIHALNDRVYDGACYRCISAHTSAAGNQPSGAGLGVQWEAVATDGVHIVFFDELAAGSGGFNGLGDMLDAAISSGGGTFRDRNFRGRIVR